MAPVRVRRRWVAVLAAAAVLPVAVAGRVVAQAVVVAAPAAVLAAVLAAALVANRRSTQA